MIGDAVFFAAVLPLSVIAGLSDLRTMKIPNWISIALIAAFLVIGLIFLPFETFLWRIAAGLIALFLGFILNAIGAMGGGDAKYLAAIMPYVAFETISDFFFILAISMLATLLLHRIAMRIGFIRRATEGWASWEAGRYFPMGISIATGIVTYLGLKLFSFV